MTIASELASRIVGTRVQDITPGAVAAAKVGLLDTIGVGIAGSADEAAEIARRVLDGGEGPCRLWGTGRRAAPSDAALANGIAANVLDFDDCTFHLGGHPSSPVLPALIALAEMLGRGGREVLTAYVVGFEVETQLGRGVNFHHYEKGWHPTSTLGVFGAGAACARLLGLDAARTTRTLALCASLAGGLKANLGSMGKPLHIGQCARSGLMAARLAAEGFTANADALEHHQGFFEVFNGAGNYDASLLLAKWGEPWEIESPGIDVKQYPCCLSTQSAVDLMLDLVRAHGLTREAVTAIRSKTAPRRLEHTNRPAPRSALDAKLSIQYVLAKALVDGAVRLDHFDERTFTADFADNAIGLVHAEAFETDAGPDMGAEIEIALADGSIVRGTIEQPVGHGEGNSITQEALETKFRACVAGRLPADRAEAVIRMVREFETLERASDLTDSLA